MKWLRWLIDIEFDTVDEVHYATLTLLTFFKLGIFIQDNGPSIQLSLWHLVIMLGAFYSEE